MADGTWPSESLTRWEGGTERSLDCGSELNKDFFSLMDPVKLSAPAVGGSLDDVDSLNNKRINSPLDNISGSYDMPVLSEMEDIGRDSGPQEWEQMEVMEVDTIKSRNYHVKSEKKAFHKGTYTDEATAGNFENNFDQRIDEALEIANNTFRHIDETLKALKTLGDRSKQVEERSLEIIKAEFDKISRALQKRKSNLFAKLRSNRIVFEADLEKTVKNIEEKKKNLETRMNFASGLKKSPSLRTYCDLNQLVADLKVNSEDICLVPNALKLQADIRCDIQCDKIIHLFENIGKIYRGQTEESEENLCRKESYKCDDPLLTLPKKNTETCEAECSMEFEPQEEYKNESRPLMYSQLHHVGSTVSDLPQSLRGPDVIIEEVIDDDQSSVSSNDQTPGPDIPINNQMIRTKSRRKDFQELVYLSHVINPCNFYIHRFSQNKARIMLEKKLKFYSMISKPCCSSDILVLGEVVVVKNINNVWCRGNITELIPLESKFVAKPCGPTKYKIEDIALMKVFLLDYGKSEVFIVSRYSVSYILNSGPLTFQHTLVKDICHIIRKRNRTLDAELKLVPPFAVHCALLDIVPRSLDGYWPKEVTDTFLKMLNNKGVLLKVYKEEDSKLFVDLKKPSNNKCNNDFPVSLREALVFLELASFRFSSLPATIEKTVHYAQPVLPRQMTQITVIISHTNGPSDFYIHVFDDVRFGSFMQKIQNVYSNEENENLEILCPVIGQACIAKFEDEHWYRCKVVGIPGNKEVDVKYVDFGNVSRVSVKNLRQVKEEFLQLPQKAICCCLACIEPCENNKQWSTEECETFESLTSEKKLTCTVLDVLMDNKLSVKLFDDRMRSINDMLAVKQVASIIPCTQESCNMNEVWDPANLTATPEDQTDVLCKELQVRITHIVSPSKIFVQWLSSEPLLRSLHTKMYEVYHNSAPETVSWIRNMFVAVQLPVIKQWRRGQIKTIVTENLVEVLHYDFGIQEVTDVSNIRMLNHNMKTYGSLCLECALKDIRPAGGSTNWTATACDVLSYYLKGAVATMIIEENTAMWPLPVMISRIDEAGQLVDISDFLVSRGLALKERRVNKSETLMELKEVNKGSSSVIKSDDFSASETIQEHKSVIKSDDFSASEMIQEHKSVIKSDDFSASEMIQEHKSVIKSDDFSATEMIQEHKSVIKSYDLSTSEMIQEHKSKFNNAAFVKNTEIMQPGSDEPMIDQSLEEPYLSPIIPDKDNFSAKVSCVGEEGIIYVIQKGLEENLNELMVDIQKSFKGLGLLAPYSWKKGEGCLIKGSDTMSYRGKVLEILGRDMIRVQYEDYGNIEKIPTCHLYPFVFNSHIPRFCIPCQLHDNVPIGDTWQSDTIQLLEELLMDRNVEIQVVEPPISSGSIMSVHIYCSNASVSDILKQHGHWIPEVCEKVTEEKQRGKSQRKNCIDSGSNYFSKSILENNFESSFDGLLKQTFETPVLPRYTLPSLPNPGQLFAVSITHIQTPNEVYICMDPMNKISIETDTDDSECSDLDEDILESKLKSVNITANSLPFLTDFRPDMPCLAKYAVDGQLYRAKLQSFINCDPVQFVVEFVDYGSTTILDTNSICQLPESLIHYPQKAIKVKLAGFKPPLEDFEADRLPYCREWSMKALWAMKELLQEKQLFASCVTSFPDVSIRLYDKTKHLVHKPLISMGLADLDF